MSANVHIRFIENEAGDLVDLEYFHHACAPSDVLGWPAPEAIDYPVYCASCGDRVAVPLTDAGRSYMAERATLQAEDMGAEAGRAAASWYEVSADNAASILRGIGDGDPAIMDTLPSAPLSGEWAGDPLPADILAELDTSDLEPEEADELLTAYENAYSQAAQDEVQRMARIHYTGPHVVGS